MRADCPTLEHVVVIDDRGRLPAGAISFDDIFDLATVDPGEIREWTTTWKGYSRDKVATIVHTSGTTAQPKGVVLTHGNILHNFEAGIQAGNNYLITLDGVIGSRGGIPLLEGGKLIGAIGIFIDAWNERCEPFVWTNTADQIIPQATRGKRTSIARH